MVRTKPVLLAGGALLLTIPSAAWAQETSPNAPRQEAPADIAAPATVPISPDNQSGPAADPAAGTVDPRTGDIIVTAQRRDESLSRTPVAVQIVGSEALERAQIRTQDDLRFVTPGLSIRSGVDSNEINFAVRGQSQDPLSDTLPGAVPYFNEVPISFSRGASVFYDLQSVQVLKGPQGTLFGRTATGGAILVTTAKPQRDFGGYVSGSLGNYDLRLIEGGVNVPVVDDTLLVRVAGIYRERNGFQRNIFPGLEGRIGDSRRWGVRPSVTLDVGAFRNELVVDYFRSRGTVTPVISGLVPFTGMGPPFVPIELIYAGTNSPAARATAIGVIGAFTGGAVPPDAIAAFYDAYFAEPGHNPGGIRQELIDQRARGPFVVNSDGPIRGRAKRTTITNISTIEIGPETVLKNIFGYIDVDTFTAVNSDGTPFGLGNHILPSRGVSGGTESDFKGVSEEIQLQGTILDGRFDYTAGLYYSNEDRRFFNVQPFFDILFGGVVQTNFYTFEDKSYAAYGQGTYKLNDAGFSVTAGLRYTIDEREKHLQPGDSFRVANPTAPPGFDYDQSSKYKKLSYQLGIQNQVTPTTLLYLVHRRAHKPGGFNGTVAPRVGDASVAGDSYGAEKVSDVEAGAKFQGRIGTVPARVSLSAYHFWLRNSQRLAFTLANGNPSSLTVNVPKGKTYGLEIEGQFSPTPWISLGGVFNYVNASFSPTPVLVNGASQIFDQVPDTPERSGTIYVDLTPRLWGNVTGLLHGDVYAQSKTFVSPRSAGNEGGVINSYAIANFRVGIQDDEAGWSLTANLKNAFDKTYYVGGLATGEIFQINVLVPAEPRTWSIDARFRF